MGPYLPGIWDDNMISNNGLVHKLEPEERCKKDDGYCGSAPVYAKLPTLVDENPARAAIQQRVRNRQRLSTNGSRIGPFLLSLIATS